MRVGTPGFIAARLTEGREARGITQTVLSELTGIKSQSISHYEQGRQSPSPEGLSLLAAALALPERFFLRSTQRPAGEATFFRQPAAASRASVKTARTRAEHHLTWLQQIDTYIRQYIDLPEVILPASSAAPVDQLADETRGRLNLSFGPPDDLIPILEQHGWIIARISMDAELGGSCSRWADGVPYLALCSEETRSSWVQYNIAHELGHIVLHRELAPAEIEERHKDLEAQADRFARAFLLPARTFTNEVWAPSINALLSLKNDWRCPISVMITRCGELGLLDQDQVRRAATNMVRRGWKASEPREIPETEKPRLLARGIELILDEGLRDGGKDRHTILTELALSATDIEQLCGLPPGFLSCAQHPHQPAALRLRDAPHVVITQV